MATITDLDTIMRLLAQEAATMTLDEYRVACIGELRRRHPGEKLYIPAPDQSKKQQVIALARQLPTGVVATRLGVSQRYARKLAAFPKKRN